MTPTYFLWVSIIAIIIVCGCTIINNAQFHLLHQVLIFLREHVKKSLILNSEITKARKVTLEDVPKLEKWYNECQNYGIINILGFISSVSLLISGLIYHSLSYIIVLFSAMFLTSNLMFLPRALHRLKQTIDINNDYVLLIKGIEKKT